MKKFLTLLLLVVTVNSIAQTVYGKKDEADYIYSSFSFDVNMAFGLKDNDNTLKPDRGFDWDLEVGARHRHVAVYLFYGQFNEFDYQIYGAGLDYYAQWLRDLQVDFINPFNGKKIFKAFDGIEFSAGVYYSQVIREDYDGNKGSFTAWASPRGQIIIWNGDIGLLLAGKYQYRGELAKHVFEGSLGVVIKFDR